MKSSTIIGGKSDDFERSEADFYATPPEATHALMKFLCLSDSVKIWEPACGDGSMSEVLKEYCSEVVSTDVRPNSGYGRGNVDFATVKHTPQYVDGIITNPPFNLAHAFIYQCDMLCVSFYALLLKATYWHSSKRLKIWKAHTPSYVLPLTWRPAMDPSRGSAPTMDFAWTVWIEGVPGTKYIPLSKPIL